MNRIVITFLPLVLAGCCFGDLGNLAFDQNFVPECESACREEGGAESCGPYCTCMAQRIHADHREAWSESTPEDQLMADPWFQQVTGACGSDYHDRAFLRGCTSECVGCEAFCSCTLAQLRVGMTQQDGTVWMIQNIEQAAPTPVGQARMDAAIEACRPSAPPG